MLEGVKVIELSEWGFVPASAAVLADWGADVIKIEHPERGDPLRTIMGMGLMPDTGDFNMIVELFNRGKRSLGLDLNVEAGRELFLKLVAQADVLVTSFLEPARVRLGLTYADLAPLNPRLIYARGTGQGPRGPDAEKAGFDAISHWARGGIAHMLTPPGGPYIGQRGGFGDITGGMTIACGVAAALFRRSVTGKGGEIDVSLLGLATWQLAPDILASDFLGGDAPRTGLGTIPNPLVGVYQAGDERFLMLNMLQPDRYWPGFCRALGREDLVADPRFADIPGRAENREALQAIIQETFRTAGLEEWARRLTANDCVWARVQTPLEAGRDPQVAANGYLVPHPKIPRAALAANPVQYNGGRLELERGAPGIGEHTEEILGELGLGAEEIARLRGQGAIR
jgi:crotonobetainyl-CoA:carnitine CoA-transferase CaiB-like acyl-CoA transferase